jgi:hypothetical protein
MPIRKEGVMKKFIITMCFLFTIVGCTDSQKTTTGWCYLISGIYLVTHDFEAANKTADQEKHKWPKIGYVEDVFYHYNDNQKTELFIDDTPTQKEIDEWIDSGFAVVVLYKISEKINHSIPFIGGDKIPKNTIYSFCSGNFNSPELKTIANNE